MSAPQLFARETLINDRRSETEPIKRLLDTRTSLEFAEQRFTFQLNRNLRSLTSITGALQASLDEPGARAARRADQIQELEQHLALTKLQRQIEDAATGNAPAADGSPAPGGGAPPANPPNGPTRALGEGNVILFGKMGVPACPDAQPGVRPRR